jgi:hypothetical protein
MPTKAKIAEAARRYLRATDEDHACGLACEEEICFICDARLCARVALEAATAKGVDMLRWDGKLLDLIVRPTGKGE